MKPYEIDSILSKLGFILEELQQINARMKQTENFELPREFAERKGWFIPDDPEPPEAA